MFDLVRTPLREIVVEAKHLFIKDETQQIGGSFKFRGPDHFFTSNPDVNSVVTASSGNHAIGVSCAARKHGARACIYIPRNTPTTKVKKIEAAGGVIRRVDGGYEDALRSAVKHAQEKGETLLPSYDHPLIIAGNRGLYREAEEQAGMRFARIAVPVGGGGCISAAIQEGQKNGAQIIAGEYAPFERIQHIALNSQSDEIQTDNIAEPSTEGIAIKTLGLLNRDILAGCQNLKMQSVSYDELVEGCALLKAHLGIVAELGACAGVAAALRAEPLENSPILCVVTGGNIDAALHKELTNNQKRS